MLPVPAKVLFGPFTVTSQLFYLTKSSFAIVNHKPLVPGHILVIPFSNVPRISQLKPDEVTDLFSSVTKISRMLERVYGASAFNIAIQDGADAGQSVPHVHVHVLPRKHEDDGQGDKIYAKLEGEEGDVGVHLAEYQSGRARPKFPVVEEASRKKRSMEEMESEAARLRKEMEKDEAQE